MGPFKCPDCGVWWAGFEHYCTPNRLSTNTTWGHCHGCLSVLCHNSDHVPCQLHQTGWTITDIRYSSAT